MYGPHGYSDNDLRQRLAAAMPRRPRLVLRSTKLAGDAAFLRRIDAFLAPARELLAVPPLARQQTGRRLLHVSREALRRLGTLSVAWLRTREATFLRRAAAELQAVCGFTDWNPSHYLDTAEMSLAVALAYDWLHADLPSELRDDVAEALYRLGLAPAANDTQGWVRAKNNWGQVCHAGMTAAALVLAERHPEPSFEVLRRAFHNLPRAAGEYAPDGVYPEGPTYWHYGTGFHIAFLALVESALGTSYGLAGQPGFAESANFIRHATGPTGDYVNFADANRGSRCSVELLWLASRYGSALAEESPEADAWLRRPALFARQRLAPLLLLDISRAPVFAPAATALPLDFHGRGDSELATFRGDWTRAAWFLAVKAGRPGVSHGHMDIGGFVLEAHGARWAEDAGAEDYHALEVQGYKLWDNAQEGPRWGILRYGPESHNIPVIDGGRQNVRAHAGIAVEGLGGSTPVARIDLTPLYGSPVERTFRFEGRRSVTIEDRFDALRPGATVRWQMLTQATVAGDADGGLRLRRGSATLRLAKTVEGPWTVTEAEALRQPWDSPLPGFRRIAFECCVPAGGHRAWAVRCA